LALGTTTTTTTTTTTNNKQQTTKVWHIFIHTINQPLHDSETALLLALGLIAPRGDWSILSPYGGFIYE
jgi:hypothetical protein